VLRRNFADFIQENRAAVGLLEPPDSSFMRTVKRLSCPNNSLSSNVGEAQRCGRSRISLSCGGSNYGSRARPVLSGGRFAFDQDVADDGAT